MIPSPRRPSYWPTMCVISAILLASQPAAVSAACDCGPDFCLGDPRYPGKLAAKKAAMTNDGYPADLVALMNRDGACVARVERAPDGFSIRTVKPTGSLTIEWTADNERIARDQLLKGMLTAYYKFNTPQALACCGEKKPEERPDWDAALQMNKSLVIACRAKDGAVSCEP